MTELKTTDAVPRLPGPNAPSSRGLDGLSWLYGVALLILAFAVARLWIMPPGGPAAGPGADTVSQRAQDFEARLAGLESRLGPVATDTRALAARLGALEQRVAAMEHMAAPVVPAPPGQAAGGETTAGADSGLAGQVVLEHQRLTSLARLEAVQLALTQGRPLGDWTDAPDALARFAKSPPPTEAILRVTFEAAAQSALAAGRSLSVSGASVWQRALARIEALVTVREGDQVLLGDPAAGTIAHARHALEAGDVAGAVDALRRLPPDAMGAFSGWIARAQALLDARAALATLAAGI